MLRLVDYCLESPLQGAVGRRFVVRHLRRSNNDCESVIEIVGNASCEPSDSLKLLQSLDFLFKALALPPLFRFMKFPLYRRKQAFQIVFRYIVLGTQLQRGYRRLLADGAGNEDEGNFRTCCAQEFKRVNPREL